MRGIELLGALPPIQTNTITQDNVDSFTFGRVTHGFSIGSGSSIGVLFAIPRAYGGYDLQIDFGDVAISWRIRTGTSWSLWKNT